MILILFWLVFLPDPGSGLKNGKTTPLTPVSRVVIKNIPKNRHKIYVTSPMALETTIGYLVEYYDG